MEKTTMKSLEGEEFAVAAQMYLRAFHVPDVSWAVDLVEFWKSLKEHKIGHFVAAKSTTIVGMGAVFPYQSCAWIGHMAVEPHLQRKGIGTLLLNELLHILETKKIRMKCMDAVPPTLKECIQPIIYQNGV